MPSITFVSAINPSFRPHDPLQQLKTSNSQPQLINPNFSVKPRRSSFNCKNSNSNTSDVLPKSRWAQMSSTDV